MRADRLKIGAVVLAVASASLVQAGERVVMESILVRVNDRIVTSSEFAERLRQELSQFSTPPTGADLRQYAERMFDDMVSEMVLLERADERHVTADDETVDRAIQSLREENDLLDDDAFQQALASSGLTEEKLRERYRQTILLQRAVQGEITPTEITEEEVRRRYERDKELYKVPAKVELEQLFFPVADDRADVDAVLGRVEGLLGRVRNGADLTAEATLAGVEVQQLGAIPLDDLRPELRAALDGLDEGQLSEPLALPGGLQVLRLVRRIPAGYQPFDEVKEAIRRQLSEEAYKNQTSGLVDRLKQDYLVEVHRDRLASVLAQLGAGNAG